MIKNKALNKMVSIILAAAMAVSFCTFTSFAEDDTVYDENFIEDTVITDDDIPEDTMIESNDKAAGAYNDEKEVTVPAKKIKLTCGSLKNITLGDSFQITNKFSPSNSDDYVTYKSYNSTVAQVSSDGVVTAVGVGKAQIRVKASSGAKVNVTVNVKSSGTEGTQVVSSIQLVDQNIMLRKGKTATIEYVLYPIGSSDSVSYKSSNTNIVTVSSKGVITGINEGTATITLKTAAGITAECSVTIYTGIYKGIDVSKWQGDIKWNKVKNAGIDYAMIRSSFGSSDVDLKLSANVAGCEKYDIPYGFYHYTYAKTTDEARKEAKFLIKTIQKYSPEYPIVLDIEESFYKSMSKTKVTNIICAFIEELENAGYYAMVYSYATFFNDYVDMSRMEAYDIWVACWGDSDRLNSSYDYHYGMWQYSATGKVSGISGDVDLDYSYKDYADKIRKYGLNNL